MRAADKAFILALVVVGAGLQFTGSVPEPKRAQAASGQVGHIDVGAVSVYSADIQPGAFRAGMVIADSLTVANLTSTTTGPSSPATRACARFTIGTVAQGCRANVTVWAHFSVAGQTCQVALLYEDLDAGNNTTDVPGPSATYTLTATGFTDAAGKFMSAGVPIDSGGAAACRVVLVTAPASGSVDFHVGSS